MIDCSLIISFYKKIDYLKLIFAGLERQSFRNFEVIVADDGSPQNIIHEIEQLSKQISFPLIHVWHEDKGFRKNRTLNSAIRASSSNYFVFIDGDCVPHREFILEHFANRESNKFLSGRRVNLSAKFTRKLSYESVKNGYLENNLPGLIFDGLFGKSIDVEKGFYLKNNLLRNYINSKKRGILGCNFSVHKSDIEKINGFDERYEAPSIGEDSDVQFRLELLGIKMKSLNNIAVQYHLHHKILERNPKNLELFAEVKKNSEAFTKYGLLK